VSLSNLSSPCERKSTVVWPVADYLTIMKLTRQGLEQTLHIQSLLVLHVTSKTKHADGWTYDFYIMRSLNVQKGDTVSRPRLMVVQDRSFHWKLYCAALQLSHVTQRPHRRGDSSSLPSSAGPAIFRRVWSAGQCLSLRRLHRNQIQNLHHLV
jgi:hypothetical protein